MWQSNDTFFEAVLPIKIEEKQMFVFIDAVSIWFLDLSISKDTQKVTNQKT